MKLSISNIAWEKKDDDIVYGYMKECGFSGVEIAPTRWVQEEPYEHVEQAIAITEILKKQYNYVVPSMQSIWFGRNERLFASGEERDNLLAYTKKAIDYAVAIGCRNLVFGCPKNRNIAEDWCMKQEDVEAIALEFFRELGAYAVNKGTIIGMEANPAIYHTNYVNTTMEALELIEKVNSKGFLLNLDVGTMIQNEESVNILDGKVSMINHVHVSEPVLKPIEQRDLHKKLADVLRREGYDGFVSVEMGKRENVAEIKAVMQYVAEVFHD